MIPASLPLVVMDRGTLDHPEPALLEAADHHTPRTCPCPWILYKLRPVHGYPHPAALLGILHTEPCPRADTLDPVAIVVQAPRPPPTRAVATP